MGMKPRAPIDLGGSNCLCCEGPLVGDTYNRMARICRECEGGDCLNDNLHSMREDIKCLQQEVREQRDRYTTLYRARDTLKYYRKINS